MVETGYAGVPIKYLIKFRQSRYEGGMFSCMISMAIRIPIDLRMSKSNVYTRSFFNLDKFGQQIVTLCSEVMLWTYMFHWYPACRSKRRNGDRTTVTLGTFVITSSLRIKCCVINFARATSVLCTGIDCKILLLIVKSKVPVISKNQKATQKQCR